jgi:hypothetical protein
MSTLLNPPEVELQKAMAIAQDKGDGQFTIRVTKKNPNSMVPLSMITFNDGAIAHLANLESWVPRLVGGGEYTIVANHVSNVGVRFVFACNFPNAPFATVNTAAITQMDWTGPTHPTGVAEAPPAPVSLPPSPSFSFQARPAPMTMQAAGATAGAQAFQQMPADAGAQLLAVQRHAAEESAKLAAREAAQAQREAEDRLRREMLDRESKHKAEMDSLKALIIAQNKPAEKTDYAAMAIGIASALAPIVKTIMDSGSEARRVASEQSNKLAEMQMQNSRELAAIQQKANEQQTALLMKLTERPSTSPEMTAMLELHKASTESQASMMNQIVNATGMVSKMSIGMIETIADMNAPPEGSPILDAVKEGVKALGALAGGAESGAKKAIAAQQQSLPKPQQPQQKPQPTPQQIEAAKQRAAQVNQQAAQQQQAAYQQIQEQQAAHPAQGPVTVIPFPNVRTPASPFPVASAPAPVQPPSTAVVDAPPVAQSEQSPVQAFGDADMPDGFAHIQTESVLDSLERLIRSEHNVDVISTLLFDSLENPEFKAALQEVEGDPEALLAGRLGIPWCMAHQDYLETLGESIERIGVERGIIPPEDDDNDDPDQQAAGGNP